MLQLLKRYRELILVAVLLLVPLGVFFARGKKPAGLSSLENNMIVTEILSAARESVRTGRTVTLSR